jgi:hypothetical protein
LKKALNLGKDGRGYGNLMFIMHSLLLFGLRPWFNGFVIL